MLGPLLFLIYINDLPNVSRLLSFFLFADDTNIYFETDIFTKLQEQLKVKSWLERNKLALNIEKTNYVVFPSLRKKLPEHILFEFGKNSVTRSGHVKSLGVCSISNPIRKSFQGNEAIYLHKRLRSQHAMGSLSDVVFRFIIIIINFFKSWVKNTIAMIKS